MILMFFLMFQTRLKYFLVTFFHSSFELMFYHFYDLTITTSGNCSNDTGFWRAPMLLWDSTEQNFLTLPSLF